MKNLFYVLGAAVLGALAIVAFRLFGEWVFAFILTAVLIALIAPRKPKFGKKAH